MKKIMPADVNYPKRVAHYLPEIKQLFYVGDISVVEHTSIAIVGTRNPSSYGLQTAYEFSYRLAKEGYTVVSGLARGIDSAAHRGALKANGNTIAVVGAGLNVVYPPENTKLFNQICKKGLVLSQFAKNEPPLGKNFLWRNKTIAAISDVVLVVEGRRRSGTLNTARYAAELGKDVFAVPGRIDSSKSHAANWLISNGAGVATNPEDLIHILKSFD